VIERGATSSSWLSAGIGVTFTKSCQQDVPKSFFYAAAPMPSAGTIAL
jgi:hypothetical protein